MNLKEFCIKYNYKLSTKVPNGWNRYGNNIPSVTTILALLVDDSFEYVKKYNPIVLKKAVNDGLKVHSDAEEFFKKDSGINKCNLNVIKFHSYYKIEIISTEDFYQVDDVCGRIDLVSKFNDGHIYNIDYKYAKYKSKKYYLQMMGYKYLNGYDGKIVYLKNKLEVIDVYDKDNLLNIFIELKDYFHKLLKENKIEK